MGKVSKRNKVVSLTKTKKMDKGHKTKIFETAQSLLQGYPFAFVLSFANFKTAPFQRIREQWTDSK